MFKTIACERVGCDLDKNAIVIGTYSNNELLRKYIEPSEVPENGYVVKVINNPQNEGLKLALVCGYSAVEVFYAVVDFVDDYFTKATPVCDCLHLRHELFKYKMPDYYSASAPDIKTRSVFTWGHPEWFGHLHRDGTPISYIKGSDWKGPFHNVRAFMLISQMLDCILKNEELDFNRWR